jgi:hypothetical protein
MLHHYLQYYRRWLVLFPNLVRFFRVVFLTFFGPGEEQQLISNVSAFTWLISEITPNSLFVHSPVMSYAIDALDRLLTRNPLNAAAFSDHLPSLISCRL